MRILVVSDVHGNIDALERLEKWRASQPPFDAIWLLGDLVDYGGDPASVIEWARVHATVAIRGNHDHAMATGDSCGSSAIFLGLSVATREYFRPKLSAEALAYLGGLPLSTAVVTERDSRNYLTHASPLDPLFGYVASGEKEAVWRAQIAAAGDPAFLFLGHTHEQFKRKVGETTIVNPGSLGLPTDGDTRAAFAVFDDGAVQFHRIEYEVERALARVQALEINGHERQRLEYLLRYARVPALTL